MSWSHGMHLKQSEILLLAVLNSSLLGGGRKILCVGDYRTEDRGAYGSRSADRQRSTVSTFDYNRRWSNHWNSPKPEGRIAIESGRVQERASFSSEDFNITLEPCCINDACRYALPPMKSESASPTTPPLWLNSHCSLR